VREALKSMSGLRFRYEGGSAPGRVREVTPFGLLFGRSNYLVAEEAPGSGARNWRLDRIHDVEVLATAAAPPEGFSLQDYADESFGIYHDAVEDVVLEVTPEGAEDALRWRFHANQQVEARPDGSVLVRFRAAGMRELAWHLFTWGDRVRVRSPEILRRTLVAEIAAAARAHATESDVAGG
jgi:predicted DNA-binding transcriptional regulator YafY